jgi:hypothetical protein
VSCVEHSYHVTIRGSRLWDASARQGHRTYRYVQTTNPKHPKHHYTPSLLSSILTTAPTGGALGIGSELVRLLHSHGSHIFFGDVLISQGETLAAELAKTSNTGQEVKFLYTNVQDHLANLGLFDLALKTCGRVDHAVSVAGINREENIVDKELTLESVRKVCFVSFCFCKPPMLEGAWEMRWKLK